MKTQKTEKNNAQMGEIIEDVYLFKDRWNLRIHSDCLEYAGELTKEEMARVRNLTEGDEVIYIYEDGQVCILIFYGIKEMEENEYNNTIIANSGFYFSDMFDKGDIVRCYFFIPFLFFYFNNFEKLKKEIKVEYKSDINFMLLKDVESLTE
ncbi:MAG: hypothetical protein QXM96_04125 [Candidatus Woesearchaeota archaeon]